jgi:hypothetical protein
MKKPKNKKLSSVFPIISFRFNGDETEKTQLLKRVEALVKILRDNQKDQELLIGKGDVLSEALLIGLQSLEKKVALKSK